MHTCAICNKRFEADDPAVLYVDAYGTPRVLCAACEALLDDAASEDDPIKRKNAREALSELSHSMKDRNAMIVMRDVLDGKSSAEETEEDIEAEKAFKESIDEEEKEAKPTNPLWDYLTLAVGVVAVLAFAVWYFFFR